MSGRFIARYSIFVVVLVCRAGYCAPHQLSTVVVRQSMEVKTPKGPVRFAKAGQVLPVLQTKGDTVLIQSLNGQKGWINKEFIVELKDAAPVYDKLIRSNPRDSKLYVLRGNVWAARGDNKQAITDYTRAINLGLKTAETYMNRGVFNASAGNYDAAIADYQQAIKRGAKGAHIYVNLAAACVGKEDYAGAIAAYSEVVQQKPKEADSYIQRGIVYRYSGNWDKALVDFNKALELDENNIAALGHRGFAHYAKGEHKQAVASFNEVIRLQPEDGVAYNNRGYNLQMTGDFKGALEDYEKAIQFAPKYALAYQNKAWLLATCPAAEFRDGKESLKTAKKLCEMRQYKVASDIKSLAAAYAELGDFKTAVELQTKVVGMIEAEGPKSSEQEILKLYQAKSPFRMIVATKK